MEPTPMTTRSAKFCKFFVDFRLSSSGRPGHHLINNPQLTLPFFVAHADLFTGVVCDRFANGLAFGNPAAGSCLVQRFDGGFVEGKRHFYHTAILPYCNTAILSERP